MWSSHRCLRFRTAVMKSYEGLVGSSRYEATETFFFASLTALSASWPRREAGRCPGGTRELDAPPICVSSETSYRIMGQLCGRSSTSTSTSVDTYIRSRVRTCMPFDLGRMFSNHSSAQRHGPKYQLPSSRADRRRLRIRACSPSRNTPHVECLLQLIRRRRRRRL